MQKFQVNDFVIVNSDRGKTPGMARVIKTYPNEAEIVFDNGEKARYYFAHLHKNIDCMKRRKIWLQERAAKIGKPR